MQILLTAATETEIEGLKSLSTGNHVVDFMTSGIGMVETTFQLTKKLSEQSYDLLINCGLAGSFSKEIAIGEVVEVQEEIISELGAESGEEFLTIEEIGLQAEWKLKTKNEFPLPFKKVKSISVNTVHGNPASIEKIQKRLQPQIENMEGAAVFFVCKKMNIPFMEIRAISNYVELRNKNAWNIPLALSELKKAMQHVIDTIE